MVNMVFIHESSLGSEEGVNIQQNTEMLVTS